MKYIDADRLRKAVEKKYNDSDSTGDRWDLGYDSACEQFLSLIDSLQQEQPDVNLDKLVNEEFVSHSRTTEYGLEATYNRAELYQLIKRMALMFNARKEENK